MNISGYWNVVYESATRLQSHFTSKIGSCVMAIYMDAGEVHFGSGRGRGERLGSGGCGAGEHQRGYQQETNGMN